MKRHRLSTFDHRLVTAALCAAVMACSLSPVNHRLKIGEESFVIFVAEGHDGNTDLFAVPTGGGEVLQVTFTPLVERAPQLSPSGDEVAFLRMHDTLPTTTRAVVVMNLLSGAEVRLGLPMDAGMPTGVAWVTDSNALFVRTLDQGIWRVGVPPNPPDAARIAANESALADSAFTLWLGEPRFARAIPCAPPALSERAARVERGGVCVIGSKGDTTTLAEHAHDPLRWGTDSVGWFEDAGLVVRSLGPGRVRRVPWTHAPDHPREGSFAPAAPKDGG